MNRTALASLVAALSLAALPGALLAQNLIEREATPIITDPFTEVGGELPPLELRADFNKDGVVSVQDLYDFLPEWQQRAQLGLATVQQLYDFLNLWAAGQVPSKQ